MSFSFVAPAIAGNAPSHVNFERAEAQRSTGLVSSQTSGTQNQPIRVDPVLSRLQRMKRRVLTGARLHVAQVTKWRPALMTLTYGSDVEWDRRHLSECVRRARQWLKRRGFKLRYVWVAEIQEERKANHPDFHCVHYHLIVWLPFGLKLPFLDARGWWPHGWTRLEWLRNAVGYVAKYASKGDECARLPKGARMYGVGGLEGDALAEARWWALPGWLRDSITVGEPIRRKVGGGWVNTETGECHYSPWRVIFTSTGIYLMREEPAHSSPGAPIEHERGGSDAALVD